MEFKNGLQIALVFLWSLSAQMTFGNKITTQGTYTEYISHIPTLTCKFESSDDPFVWYLFRWNKINTKNESVPYAVMQSVGEPTWTKTVDPDFRDHVEFDTEKTDGTVSFNLRIDGFKCNDAGRYECIMLSASGEYKGYTDLILEAHPGTPVITENTIEVSENNSFNIDCRANVGLPPQMLRWAYKGPNQKTYTTLTENISRENRPTEDCTLEERSRVTLIMTSELDGAVFLCQSRGELGEGGTPMNYDEVVITLHRPATTTTPALSSTVIIIEDETDPTGAAITPSSTTQVFISAIITSILTIAQLTS